MSVRARLRSFSRTLRRPGVILTLVVLFLALLVWFVGPMIAFGEVRPFGSAASRLALLLLLALVWGGLGFLLRTNALSATLSVVAAALGTWLGALWYARR